MYSWIFSFFFQEGMISSETDFLTSNSLMVPVFFNIIKLAHKCRAVNSNNKGFRVFYLISLRYKKQDNSKHQVCKLFLNPVMDEAFPHDALEQKIDKKEAEKRHFLYNALPSDMLLVKNGFPYITYFQE